MEFITIDVTPREAVGSANAARLRRTGMVPAVLYGLQRGNINLSISGNDLDRFLRTGSHLVELRLGDQLRPAILREIQYDETTDEMLHVDFTRVDADVPVETNVPLTWKGRATGESEGGVFQALMQTVAVSARPKDLPREYVVEIAGMKLHDSLRVEDLEELPGVTFMDDAEALIAQVVVPKVVAEPVEEEAEPVEGEAASEGEEAAEAADEKPADGDSAGE